MLLRFPFKRPYFEKKNDGFKKRNHSTKAVDSDLIKAIFILVLNIEAMFRKFFSSDHANGKRRYFNDYMKLV